MKKILILLIIFVVTGCNNDKNSIVMVTESGFAPYEFYEGGQIIGVDIDISKKIAESLNKKLVIKDVSFESIINEVNSGKADFAAAGISITEERKKEVDFSIPYVSTKQVVVVKKGSKLNSINNLDGVTISVQLGTVADSYVEENFKNSKILRQKKYLAAAEDVKSLKSDCIVMDMIPALELVKENQELMILDGVLFEDNYAILVKKGNQELLDKINVVLKQLIEENKIEEYTKLYSK